MQLTRGIYAATLTPIKSDLTVDHEVLFNHCKTLLSAGMKGLVLFGTTGEGSSFNNKEKMEVISYLIKQGISPNHILTANGSSSIMDTVELARFAIRSGLKAFLISPPSFYKKVSNQGIIAYYREIIERIDTPEFPILLYHIPQCTGVPLNLEIVQTLQKSFPTNIIGLKESEGNATFTRELLNALPSFQIFVGEASHLQEKGIAGSISGLASVYPEILISLFHQNTPEMQKRLAEVTAPLSRFHFIPTFKALMEKREGAIWANLRPPLCPLSPQDKAILKQ